MTESIPTTWNDERDATFFEIIRTLGTQIDRVLADLVVAESWKSMALRSVARSGSADGDLVPAPVRSSRPSSR